MIFNIFNDDDFEIMLNLKTKEQIENYLNAVDQLLDMQDDGKNPLLYH